MANITINHYLRLINLLDGNFGYTVTEIKNKLDVNTATVYKAMRRLTDAGFQVRQLGRGIWQLVHSTWRHPDPKAYVPFSPAEADFVYRLTSGLKESHPLKESIMRKLEECYRPDLEYGIIWNPDAPRLLQDLMHAREEGRQVRIKYLSSSSGKLKEYVVEAFHFEHNLESFDVYDYQEYRVKTFKLARLRDVELLEEEWNFEGFHVVPPMDSFRSHGDDRSRVVLAMDATARNYLIELFPLTFGEVKQVSETEWLFDGMCCSMEGVGRFCLCMADHIRLLKGEAVRRYVEGKARMAAEAWGTEKMAVRS